MEKPFYKSKKFWYSVVSAALGAAMYFAGIDITVVLGILASGAVLVGGQAAADFGKNAKEVERKAQIINQIVSIVYPHIFSPSSDPITVPEIHKKRLQALLKDLAKAGDLAELLKTAKELPEEDAAEIQ